MNTSNLITKPHLGESAATALEEIGKLLDWHRDAPDYSTLELVEAAWNKWADASRREEAEVANIKSQRGDAVELRETFRIGKDEANYNFTEIGDVRLTLVGRRHAAAGKWSRANTFLRVQVFDGPNKGTKLRRGVEIPIHDFGTLTDLFGQAVRMFGKQQEETIEGLWDECEECGDAEFHYTYGCGYPPDEADDSHILPAFAAADYETASGWVWVSVKDIDRKPGTRWLGAAILKGRDSMGAYCHATAIFGCGQEAGIVTPVHRLGVIPPPELQYQIFDRAEAKRLAADLSWQMPTLSAPIKKLSPEVAVAA